MKRLSMVAITFLCVTACNQKHGNLDVGQKNINEKKEITPFFGGIQFKTEAFKKTATNALEDFNLVLIGEKPVHSKDDGALLDGGTSIYKGDGYKLTVLHKFIVMKDHTTAILYGPVLEFLNEDAFLKNPISQVNMFSSDEDIKRFHEQNRRR